ncbi:TRM11 family methyltransferase [Nocardioides sp.]|uniref:TRM11 family SAM-dependent methyltransferase n=1 Tax=Nocardioides sp. TaxID=35761 RepID=UPI003528D666
MPRYALLVQPSANRVYAQASAALTTAELRIVDERVLGGVIDHLDEETIGGVRYVTFSAPDLDERALAHLSQLSTAFALFELRDGLLAPLTLTPLARYDDDLLTILKYSGKTNETFTHLLLHVTLLFREQPEQLLDGSLRVLDPLCGRGTTLSQALRWGHDAVGLDLDRKDVEAYAGFLKSWLKRKRLKHTIATTPVRHDGKRVARRTDATVAPTKEDWAAGRTQRLSVLHADTLRAGELVKPRSVDAVVTDAPYGVQHGSRHPEHGLARRPLDLLEAAVPVWVGLLRPGGALGIAWNTHVAARDDLADLLRRHGLLVADSEPYRALQHRVDSSILRDVIVARRPS